MNKIYIVDQTQIAASFYTKSLFINGVHILDVDNDAEGVINLQSIAKRLCIATDGYVNHINLTEKTLAHHRAKVLNKTQELLDEEQSGNVNYDDWCSGYSNDDLIRLLDTQSLTAQKEQPMLNTIAAIEAHTSKELLISTELLTDNDQSLLENPSTTPNRVWNREYSYVVKFSLPVCAEDREAELESWRNAGFSETFMTLVTYCLDNRYRGIEFDPEGVDLIALLSDGEFLDEAM